MPDNPAETATGMAVGFTTTGIAANIAWVSTTFAEVASTTGSTLLSAMGLGAAPTAATGVIGGTTMLTVSYIMVVLIPVLWLNRNILDDMARRKKVEDWWREYELYGHGDPTEWMGSNAGNHTGGSYVKVNYDLGNLSTPWSVESGYRHVNMRRGRGGNANWKSLKMAR